MSDLRKHIRWKWLFSDANPTSTLPSEKNNSEYNSKIYIPTKKTAPLSTNIIESHLDLLEKDLLKNFKLQKPQKNLTPQQSRTLNDLKNNKKIIIAPADKKLGPVLLQRKNYIKLAFKNHLNNRQAYENITENCYKYIKKRTTWIFKCMLADANSRSLLPQHEITYLQRALESNNRNAYLYLTIKIHKLQKN